MPAKEIIFYESKTTGTSIVRLTISSDADQRKHQSSAKW